MTFLGLSLIYWSLIGSFALSAVIAVAWVAALDRSDALRRASLVPIAPLPAAVAVPAKWRRRNKLSTNPNQGN